MKIAPLTVGLTVVAFGTSSPELVVSLDAALSGLNDIALGNIVGSNICNLAFILALAAALRPIAVKAQILRFDIPVLIASSLLLPGVLWDGVVSRWEAGGLLLGLAAYVAFNVRMGRRESAQVQAELAPHPAGDRPLRDLLRIALGLAGLTLGAHLFVTGAALLAQRLGVTQAAIGLTVVALGTSLPELATSVVAAYRSHGDIALGNVIGSNIFNTLGILGTASLAEPVVRGGVTWQDIGLMAAAGVLLLPLLFSGRRFSRPEGWLAMAGYAAYLIWRL